MKKYLTAILAFSSFLSFAQWSMINTGVQAKIDAIHFFDSQTGIVGGGFMYPLKTTDGGATWNSFSNQSARDFSFFNAATGYCASIVSHSMSKTTNAGTSWTSITPPTSNSLWAVAATSATTAHFVGTGGVYWKTTNGGTSVTVGASGTNSLLTDIVFTSSTTGFIVEQTGKIRKTTNSGSSWSVVHSMTGVLLTEMCFVNTNVGYVVGSSGTVLKTTDAGQNWTQLTTNSTAYLQGVHFFDANRGIAAGISGVILMTIDGGQTWSQENSGTTKDLYDVRMLSGTSAVVTGDSGTILRNDHIVLGLEEHPSLVSLELYPNPAIDYVQLVGLNSEEMTYEILDEKGASLSPEEKITNKGFSVEGYPKGNYFVRIRYRDQQTVKKLVKI